MTDITEAYDFRGRTLLGREGAEIGKVDELYYDEQPEWTLVNTGLFGIKKTFVAIRGASTTGEDVQVPIAKEQVKDAPRVDAGQELSERDEGLLFEHYGVPYTTQSAQQRRVRPAEGAASESGRDDAMTRSEEELRVGTAKRERGRARLRSTSSPTRSSRPCRSSARRFGSNASRSPTRTSNRRPPARRTRKRSTRSSSPRTSARSRSISTEGGTREKRPAGEREKRE